MLIYHPAYDAYHCIFRALLITDVINVIEVSKLRILDFYYCFPAELQKVRLPKGHAEVKKLAQKAKNIYHGPVSAIQTFREMEHIQLAAFRTLAASRLIDAAELESGLFRRTETALPESLRSSLNEAAEEHKSLMQYMTEKFVEIPLLGENGLKHRTGLMEYRYDII